MGNTVKIDSGKTKMIAHQGLYGLERGNTNMAFVAAGNREKYFGIETDVHRTADGKNMFISIDSRTSSHNPLYNALKAKSFTDGDITLHFILFDILYSPDITKSIHEITREIDFGFYNAENIRRIHYPQKA